MGGGGCRDGVMAFLFLCAPANVAKAVVTGGDEEENSWG